MGAPGGKKGAKEDREEAKEDPPPLGYRRKVWRGRFLSCHAGDKQGRRESLRLQDSEGNRGTSHAQQEGYLKRRGFHVPARRKNARASFKEGGREALRGQEARQEQARRGVGVQNFEPLRVMPYFPTNFLNSSSESIFRPSFSAFSYFEPASSPATP